MIMFHFIVFMNIVFKTWTNFVLDFICLKLFFFFKLNDLCVFCVSNFFFFAFWNTSLSADFHFHLIWVKLNIFIFCQTVQNFLERRSREASDLFLGLNKIIWRFMKENVVQSHIPLRLVVGNNQNKKLNRGY